MKKMFFLMLFLMILGTAGMNAQVTIGNNKAPENYSLLELVSNGSNALRLPQLTTAQRDALAVSGQDLAMGLVIFNLDTKCIEYWNGSAWISQCAPTSVDVVGGTVFNPNGNLNPGVQPLEISGSIPPTGGTAPYTYQWQYCLSDCGNAANWKSATASPYSCATDNTKANYTPCPLDNTTWFRRQVTDAEGSTDVSNSVKVTVNLIAGTITDPNPLPVGGGTATVNGTNSSGGLSTAHFHQWEYCLDNCSNDANWYTVDNPAGGYNCSTPGTGLSYTTCPITADMRLRRRDMDGEQAQLTNTVLVTVNTANPKGTAEAISIVATGASVCQDSPVTIDVSFDPAHTPSPAVTNPVWILYNENGSEAGTSGTAYSAAYTFNVTPGAYPQTKYYAAFKGANYDENLQTDRKEVVINVTQKVTPSVTIVSDAPNNTVTQGTKVTFTATPTNGGTAPNYNWKVNGSSQQNGQGATFESSTLTNGATVNCDMTSNETCVAGTQTATSNSVTMTVNPLLSNSCQSCAAFLETTAYYNVNGWRYAAYYSGLCVLHEKPSGATLAATYWWSGTTWVFDMAEPSLWGSGWDCVVTLP